MILIDYTQQNRKCLHNDVNLMKEDQTNVIDFPLHDNPDIVVKRGKTCSPYRTEKIS